MAQQPIVTICIPYADYHSKLVERAVDSAYRQTLPCHVLVRHDAYGYGAGENRNALAVKVKTPFLIFLDADDTLEPTFAEDCLRAYRQGTYVYTDYWEDQTYVKAPTCDEWLGPNAQKMHLVTALMPTQYVHHVRGFDPQLPGGEDSDFYIKLRVAGICPFRVPKALMHYSGDGQRSIQWMKHPEREQIISTIWEMYRSRIVGCGCNQTPVNMVGGDRLDGDVLAEALYDPSKEFGMPDELGNRRFYKRQTHKGAHMWVARQDAEQWPNKWRIIDDPAAIAPDVDKVAALALQGLAVQE